MENMLVFLFPSSFFFLAALLHVDLSHMTVAYDVIENIVNSLNMVLDGDELLELPYIGERLKKSSAAAPSARGMNASLCCPLGFGGQCCGMCTSEVRKR